jgi:hypothetical protein
MVIKNWACARSAFDHIMDTVLVRSNLKKALIDEGIHRSLSFPIDHKEQKLRATMICGEKKVEHILQSCHNDVIIKESEQPSTAYDSKTLPTTLINPEDLIGPSNLLDTQQCCTRTVKLTDNNLSELKDKKTRTEFLPSTIEDESEEIKILEYLSKDVVEDIVWKYQCIYSNQGPTAPGYPGYKSYNLMLKKEWENGELTAELNLSGRDNPDDDGIFDNQDKEQDYSYPPDVNHCCSHSIYGELHDIFPTPEEIIPQDTPPPLGKHVIPTQYVDENLIHAIMSGSSVHDILHMVNKSPTDWFSKKQGTLETATYG